jgi:hypothetical protein
MRFVSGTLTCPIPLQAAEKLASSLQAKNKRFVSGCRFIDTVTSSKSDALSGLKPRKTPRSIKQNPPCQCFWRVGFGSTFDSNFSAHSFPRTEPDGRSRTPGILKLIRRSLRPLVTVAPKIRLDSIRPTVRLASGKSGQAEEEVRSGRAFSKATGTDTTGPVRGHPLTLISLARSTRLAHVQ